MMDFLKELKIEQEEEFKELPNLFFPELPTGMRICTWLNLNEEYSLSVQASSHHYCIPRAFIPIDEYKAYEVALIYKDKIIRFDELLKDFPRADEVYLDSLALGYVPTDLVNDIYLYLKEKLNGR